MGRARGQSTEEGDLNTLEDCLVPLLEDMEAHCVPGVTQPAREGKEAQLCNFHSFRNMTLVLVSGFWVVRLVV